MVYQRLLRIWANSANRARCRRCRQPIVWVIDADGKSRPFSPLAKPLRREKDDRGRAFDIFEPTSFHACPTRARQSTGVQARP